MLIIFLLEPRYRFQVFKFESNFMFWKVFFKYTLDKFLPFVLYYPLGNSINFGLLLRVLAAVTLSSALDLSLLLFLLRFVHVYRVYFLFH